MWIIFSLLAAFSAAIAIILSKAGLKKSRSYSWICHPGYSYHCCFLGCCIFPEENNRAPTD
jgi:hypothetical protein